MNRKLFAMALVVCVAALAHAEGQGNSQKTAGKGNGKKAMNLEEFCAMQKRMAEKKGRKYDQAKAEARFKKLDTNKDGKVSPDERAAARKKNKKQKAAVPEVPQPAAEKSKCSQGACPAPTTPKK